MEIKVSYSPIELNETIKYIHENNHYIDLTLEEIKESVITSMKQLASDRTYSYTHTMGYLIVIDDSVEESFDHDETIISVKIFIDPVLKYDFTKLTEREEFVIDVSPTEYWKEES